MEKILAVVAAAFVMFSFSAVGFANEGALGTCDQTGQSMGLLMLGSYGGEVISIDHNAHTIAIRGDDGIRTFDVSKLATKQIPELRDIATVEYENANGKMVASWAVSVPQKETKNVWWLNEKNV
jgi:hypothetical protein